MKKLLKDPIIWVVGLVVVLSSAFGFGMYLAQVQEKEILKIRFRMEFGQPVEIKDLDSLARKNRELVIWEKIRQTASEIVINEAVAKFILRGLDADRDPKKIAEATSAQELADQYKERLATLLDLAYRFGQFENTDQNQIYGYLAQIASDLPEPDWNKMLENIKELQPQ